MRLLELLHELREARVLVWYKGEDRIGFSHSKGTGFPEELRKRVGESKSELLEVLRANGVDSPERARATTVYKLPGDRSERRPLFSIQRGMYLQGRIDELGHTYTIPLAIELPDARPDLVERAVRALIDTEPVLRMRVYDDLTHDVRSAQECTVTRRSLGAGGLGPWHDERAHQVFPLQDGGLVLPEVVTVEGSPGAVVGLTHHHMLSDAYSVDVLADRLAELYDHLAQDGEPGEGTERERAPDYFDHAAYQQLELRTDRNVRARDELAERLAGAEKLQLGRVRGGRDNRAATTTRRLSGQLCRSLNEFAREHRVSDYSVLLAGLHHVLAEFAGGQSELAIAVTVGNRPPEFESAVGPFITTLPVVAEHRPRMPFADNARAVHETVLHLNEHQQLNLDMLTGALPGGAADLADLVQVLFTMHNFGSAPSRGRTRYRVLPYSDTAEKFGISVVAKEEAEDISLTVTYAAERYDGELVEALLDAYLVFLDSLVRAPCDLPAGQLDLVAPLSPLWTGTDGRTAPDHGTAESAMALFQEQVRRGPDRVAVVYRNNRLTYRELDERVNRLARVLLEEHGLARQSLVCLVMERSEHMLVAVLAVLRAGCAYVPVDPDLPEERVRFVVGDTETPLVLTEGSRAGTLPVEVPTVAVDEPGLGADRSASDPGVQVHGSDIAYAIYTSGTTGRPKGVLCEHRGLVNRIRWMNRRFPLEESDRVLQKTPYSFDVSVWELLWANWFGAAVVFAEPGGHRDPDYLAEVIEREQITVVHFVPSMLTAFTDALRAPGGAEPSALDSLRYLFCSGEELKPAQAHAVHELLPRVELHNLYGPTEASIDVTHFDCTEHGIDEVRLGRPIDNMRVHVLSSSRRPLPAYAVGELYIGGVGLAKGYLNLPRLTAERFVPDPFVQGERLYRTGDLGTRSGEGDIVFLGRTDFQVKVNGFRVELGEIEAALERHAGIRGSVVVLRQGVLVGYYAADQELEPELRAGLRSTLPVHAVPTALVRLDELPVTANGKLDRAALPDPASRMREETVVQPREEREATVRELCAAVLGTDPERLSISADLSRLGMDSIAAIRLAGELRQRIGLPVTVRDVFAHRTIERLYDHLCDMAGTEDSATPLRAEQGRIEGPAPVAPIQRWFFGLPLTDRRHWNQAFLIRTPELSVADLDTALRALVEHHDALRLRFSPDGSEQYYDPVAAHTGLNVLDVRTLPGGEGTEEFSEALHRTLTAWQRCFDLTRGPLHAFGYLHGFTDGSARVFFALHHLIVDGVSQRILAEDLRTLYEGGRPSGKGTSYRQWVQALASCTEESGPEVSYWERVADTAGTRAVPAAGPEEAWRSESIVLDPERTALLLGDCNRAHRTVPEDLLMTALGRALRELTGHDTHHVLREGHGREDFADDLDVTRTVGWFTSLSPFRLRVADDLGESMAMVKEDLREVPRKGLSYGPLFGYTPDSLPPVWFNYLGRVGDGTDMWEPYSEGTGDPMPEGPAPGAALAVLASSANGRLRVRLDSRLGAARTRALRASLEQSLIDIVDRYGDQRFVDYTPSDFREVRGEDDLSHLPAPCGSDPFGWFPLTDLQQAYLVGRFGGYEIGNVANHVYTEHVYPALDTDRLETAVNRLVAECDVLRTVFSLDRMAQRVLAPEEVPHFPLPVHRFTEWDEEALAHVRERLSHEVHDAERFPLFAFEVSVFPERCVLHVSFDLLAVDVRSRLAILGRLDDLYRGTHRRPALPEATFKDYQTHVGRLRNSRWYERDRDYWSGKLADMPSRCSLPFRFAPETVVHPRFAEHTEHVGTQAWERFKEQAALRGLSPSSVLLSLFGSILAHFSGSTEFPITVTVARRLPVLPEVGRVLGNFTSTVLHHFVDDPADAEALARRTHDVLWEDVAHSLYSGVTVQRDLARARGLETAKAVSPIVFTGAVGSDTRDFEAQPHLRDDEILSERHWEAQTSQAWIDLQAVETANGFAAKWLYVEQLFHREDIAHFNRLFRLGIERLAEGRWERGLPRHLYLPDADRALIERANDTGPAASAGFRESSSGTSDTLFGVHEQWCRTTGAWDRTAVIDAGTGEHTHGELVDGGRRLARALLEHGEGGELVAVLAQKGYVQVLATTAVMRSGAGYLPLHTDWPVARMADILRQAGVRTVLLSREQYERSGIRAGLEGFTLLVVEELTERETGSPAPARPRLPRVAPDDIAYVIFTSGSTGRPKGVTISHRGALTTVLAVNERLGVGPDDRVLALSELSFDLSVYDLFGVLAAGGTVVFPDQEGVRDPEHWVDLVRRYRVTLWNTVPQLAGLLVEEAEGNTSGIETLRAVLMSGDWIPTPLPERIRHLCPEATVMSLGGATEGSIWSIWYEIDRVDPAWRSIPYGTAMPGQSMYVLTASGEHAPVGVPGEIHIGGAGVALDYWRAPELTADRFVEHPALGRLYRTGDLGRWHREGHMEFLGRADFQVKLNGYRVELGEVEHVLALHPEVSQAVALVHETEGAQVLVGYYVADTALDHDELRELLVGRLPAYMVPEQLLHLAELPLSPNGKLDRSELPQPAGAARVAHIAPGTPEQARIRDLWADLLGVAPERLGVRDDLLQSGADSILAIRMAGRLRRELGIAVGVSDVFTHRTIESFCERVLPSAVQGSAVRAEQGLLVGEVPPLPMQSWFEEQRFPRPHHWNQSFLVGVPELDTDRLQNAVGALVEQHDALRIRREETGLCFATDASRPPLRLLDVSELGATEETPEFTAALDRVLTEWQSGFDLVEGPLLSVGYLHGFRDGGARIFLAAHHLAVDGVSWQLLVEDLRAAYEGAELGAKTTSVRQWADALAEYAGHREHQRSYWEEPAVPVPGVLRQERDPLEVRVDIDPGLTGRVLHDCQRFLRTGVHEFLLTALAHALGELTGVSVHRVALEGHGREDIAADLDTARTVGWFTSLYPCTVRTSESVVDSLVAVKETLRSVPDNGIGYGPLVGYERPMPAVCFNYLGHVDGGADETWRITGEPAGTAIHPDNVLPYAVNLAGMVVGGRLRFRLTARLSRTDTERLARSFEAALAELVEATADRPRTRLTSSDVDGILPQHHLDRLQRDEELDDVLLATGLQQGMLAHAVRQGEVDDAYRVQAVWDYEEQVDPELLYEAWKHAQRTFGCLRTGFDWQHELVQVIRHEAELDWEYTDLSRNEDPGSAFEDLLAEDRATPYDLESGALFRVRLARVGKDRFTCLLNTHHAVLDGWSSPLLLDAVHEAYRSLRDGRRPPEPADHAPEGYRYLQRRSEAHDEYWREYVRGAEETCDLDGLLRPERRPVDLGACTRVEDQRRETLTLGADRSEKVRRAASRGGVTLNAVLNYAWHRVLATYGNCATTVVGTVLAGRDLPVEGIEQAVGLFLSTVPLIVRHDDGTQRSLLDGARDLQHDIQEANTRSTVDLAALQPAGQRLFDTLFIYENYPDTEGSVGDDPRTAFRFRHQKRDYPLVVSVFDDDAEGIGIALEYAGELIPSATAWRLLAAVEAVLMQFVRDPGLAAGRLQLADRADVQLQQTWNETGTAEPPEPLIHRAFEQQAAQCPDAPAVEWRGGVLSYGHLDRAANRLAHRLLRTVGGGAPTLVLLDRGPDLMVALLAILKAGGAYIPVDPDYPDERISHVVASSGARCAVLQDRHRKRFEERFPELESVCVDGVDHSPGAEEEGRESPCQDMTGDEPAYVIYTSGSTGRPKGVVVEHRSVMSTVRAVRDRHFPGAGALRTVSTTNHVFDIFGLEYGLTLLGGGTMVLGDAMAPDLDCTGLDFVQMTPTLLEMKRDVIRNGAATRLLVGGEALDRRLLDSVLPKFAEVVNVYGPTETTIWSMSAAYRAGTGRRGPVTIGRALPGEGAHVLGRGLLPLPVGAVGELHLTGCGLARGYAGDTQTTEARFVRAADGRRLYRTGDLVRWLPEGEIEYVGRIDNQVKLRGHRLELGEVEAALADFPGVRSGLARVVSPSESRAAADLVGYYVPERGAAVDEKALAEHLAVALPSHARPAELVRLTEVPLTHSGKLDVRALPVPSPEPERPREDEPLPLEGTASVLARVWCDVLGRERVGAHDRFFDLGGNSVLLTKVHGRLPEEIRARVGVNDLFTYPTIASLTRHLEGSPDQEGPAVSGREDHEKRSAPGAGGYDGDAVAVIGMACRFPDADGVDEYWSNLRTGHCSVVHHTREELSAAGVPEELLDHPGYVRAQSALRDIGGFDAEFFGYSRREAENMDPQHRIFLECAWHALEDALHDPTGYRGAVGVFAGSGRNDYLDAHVRPAYGGLEPSAEYQAMINNRPDFLATKTAYRLNLTGPAMTVQTACSSSLVAVHQAVNSLLVGDCDMALAGGVSIGQLGRQGYLYQEGMVFSADGFCRAFDADAQGTVEGQGAGLVVLKPLSRALADGDPVRAVIRGSAVNNDGHDKVGYTAPSTWRQTAVIRAAHRRAGIDPGTIGYVEAHGTGTVLGDPIEFAALKQALGTPHEPGCAIGSVKANMGHLDAASGVAGLIKAVLCLENRTLVPTPHHRRPNPALGIEGSGFFVNTECRPWEGEVLRAGVSSFGIGGTNAHLVLETAPSPEATAEPHRRGEHMLVVSGRTREAVREQSRVLARHLEAHPGVDPDRVGYTLLTARARFDRARVLVGADRRELVERLEAASADTVAHLDGRSVVFLFPGQGAQYEGMGTQLYRNEASYRSAVDECVAVLRRLMPGVSVDDLLGRTAAVHEPQFTQPALFVMEYALARWLMSSGVRPTATVGHSLGEYVSACLAGVFSLPDALRLVCERGRVAADSPPGAMLAVPLSPERVLSYGADVDLAAVNESDDCVVAGTPEAIGRFADILTADGVPGKRLPVRRAFHSRLLDPVLEGFERMVESIGPKPPEEHFISSLTGDWADPAEITRPSYWVRHLREPVAFAAALDTLHSAEHTANALFIEVGPGRALARLARKHPGRSGGPVVSAVPDREREQAGALTALGTVHATGSEADASALYGLGPADRVRIPGYAFQRTEHWAGPAVGARGPAVIAHSPAETPAGTLSEAIAEAWRAVLGVGEVGPEDDFFDQGGDSLAAVQLVSRIERATGIRTEPLELSRCTPAALLAQAEAGRDRGTAPVAPLVRLSEGEPSVPPLVLIHPVGGDVYFYRELARCLPERLPVFAVRSPMLDGSAEFDTVEGMANHYLDLLDDLTRQGPYRLGGASFGGLVAHGMAQRVAERTPTAPDLILIDSPAQGHLPPPMSDAEILHYLVRYGIPESVCRAEQIEELDTLDAKIAHLAAESRGTAFEEMLSADFLPRYLSTWQRHTRAMHRYVPKPYRGGIRFYSHTEAIPDFPTGQEQHWRPLAQGAWRHVPVPGNHLSMNTMPHVARIAEDLADLAEPVGFHQEQGSTEEA